MPRTKHLFFLISSFFLNKALPIPFKADLLFHFFNKKTQITDAYLQDPISTLKLYPRKSNNIVTTSANTHFHVAKELVDYTQGFRICMDVYYNPATLNTSAYCNWINGRGNNTGFHSGMAIPGSLNENAFLGCWRNNSASSTISKSGLTADWYRYYMDVTATTVQIHLLNLRTGVLLDGTVASVGTVDNGDTSAFTFLSYGISGITGAYGSVGVNIAKVAIYDGNGLLKLLVPLSAGTGTRVADIVNKTQYQLSFFISSTGWAKTCDFFHAHFKYGFDLYKKPSNPDFYVCHATDGSSITVTKPASDYALSGSYGPMLLTYTPVESKFKLDDVSAGGNNLVIANATATALLETNGTYEYNGLYNGYPSWFNATKNIVVRRETTGYWSIIKVGSITYYTSSVSIYSDPRSVPYWWGSYGSDFLVLTYSAFPPSDLYSADPDHVLFTEGTGVAKEFNVSDIKISDGIDRGYLYINETIEQKDFMLYGADKTLLDDLKVIKFVGQEGRISYDEDGVPNYDENNHVELGE